MATAYFQPLRFAAQFAAMLLASAGLAAAPARENGLPFVQLFRRGEYRGHAQVWCGVADTRGLLYFGNYAQVLVYDGVQWDRIAVPGATFVRALAIDAGGRIWVGGSGALGYIDPAAAAPRFTSLVDRLPAEARAPGDIMRVHVLGDSVYFQSQNWLLRWRNDRLNAWPLADPGVWQSMVVGDQLVVQNPAHGWFRVGATQLERAEAGLTQLSPTRFALPMSDGRTLIGTTRTGFFSYDGRGLTRTIADSVPYLRDNFLFNGLRLADGRYLMSTLRGGAMILAPDLACEAVIDEAAGLPGNTVNSAFADPQGGLWLCLDDGIARVADAFAASWFRPPGPLARLDGFTLERFGGRLYLGAGRDLMRLAPAAIGGTARWEVHAKTEETIAALLAVDDTLLVAAGDGVYAGRAGQVHERVAELADCTALLAPAALPGRVFVTHRGGVSILRRGAAGWKLEEGGFGAGIEAGSLAESADGVIWVAGRDRILRLTFPNATGAPTAEVFDVNQRLWRVTRADGRALFLTEHGLRRFDPTQKRLVSEPAYGARFADGSTPARAVVEDGEGGTWIAPAHAGDTRTWSETTLGRVTHGGAWEPLAVSDLTRIGDIHGLRIERDGGQSIMWVAGVSGILRVNLSILRALPPAGATLVREAVAADGRTLLGDGRPLTLAATQNSVRFRVAAPGLDAADGRQFETELRGLAHAGVYLGTSAEREFNNLWEGRYVFHARARGANGRWTAPIELAFVVLPPWWRTPWAYAIWAALAAAGVFAVVWLRTRALRQRAFVLEATVAERTMELSVRNQELTRLHRLELDEKISARLAEEKARLEVLRYQLNPHFLFNALNSICTQIMQQPAAARAMVVRLADFCRQTLHRPRGEGSLTLGEELEHLRTYLDIEKVRLGELLEVEIFAAPGVEGVRVPPFLLLPLVENAVKYGAATSPDRVGIRLGVQRDPDDSIVIEVANTGTWVVPGTSSVHSTSIGLENLRQRLARHFPDAHEFTTEARDGWVIVKLRIFDRSGTAAQPAETGNRKP